MFAKVGNKLLSFGSSILNGYKKFRFHRDKFFTHRHFLHDKAEKVYIDNAKRNARYYGRKCYSPKKISENCTLHNDCLWVGKERYPIVKLQEPYDQSYNGNTIYAIPSAIDLISPERKEVFGYSKKELKDKIIVIEVDSSGKIAPVDNGKALYYSFSGDIKLTSFRVVDRKTGETRWISSLIMFPFNLSGAVSNFACRITGGVLNKIGGLFLNLSKLTSKGLDDRISVNKKGVLKSSQSLLKTRSVFTFIFESLASLFITTGIIVEGTGCVANSLLRTPNLIFHHDDMDRKATWANIKSSFVNTFRDLSSTKKYATSSLKTCKTRIDCDTKKPQELKNINENAGDKARKKDKDPKSPDLNSNELQEASKGLNGVSQSKTTIIIGTKKGLSSYETSLDNRTQRPTNTSRGC